MKEFVVRIMFYDDGTYDSDFEASEALTEIEKVALVSILRDTTNEAIEIIEDASICIEDNSLHEIDEQ